MRRRAFVTALGGVRQFSLFSRVNLISKLVKNVLTVGIRSIPATEQTVPRREVACASAGLLGRAASDILGTGTNGARVVSVRRPFPTYG